MRVARRPESEGIGCVDVADRHVCFAECDFYLASFNKDICPGRSTDFIQIGTELPLLRLNWSEIVVAGRYE